jgi:membrane fusion protein, heavy metal efflux system
MSNETVKQPAVSAADNANGQTMETVETMEAASKRESGTLRARIGGHLPTIAVIALLGGVGVYGHHSGWKVPKFSMLAGRGAAENNDWCEEHGVPESQCVQCHPDLLPSGKDFGWCKEHGVANCPLCHPEVAQLKQIPPVAAADRRRAARALVAGARAENNPVCKNYLRRIQFASLAAMRKAGVDVAVAERQPIVESIAANGQITYDQTRFASLSARLPGTVWRVEKNVGDQVHAGDLLALVDAAEVGRAKTELLQALAQDELARKSLKRLESLGEVVAGRQVQEAQAATVQARARLLSTQQALECLGLPVDVEPLRALPAEKLAETLRYLGLPVRDRQQHGQTTANLLPVKAPMDGLIVTRHVVAGEVIDPSRVLFQLADTSRMWLTLNVPAEDAGKLALGQPVRFRPDGQQDEAHGTLVWISSSADQQTRMVSVRAELSNPRGQLRHETFGAGSIILRQEQESVAVPTAAIHWEGDCHIVFVRDKGFFDKPDSPKVFHVRTVRLGAESETATEIIAGVLPGEVVAARGSDVLRAELLKNNLGEGCCCCGGGKK